MQKKERWAMNLFSGAWLGLASLALATVVGAALFGLVEVPHVQAEWMQTSDESVPDYDVVSIKPNQSGSSSSHVDVTNEYFRGTNITLKTLIRYAYDLQSEDVIYGLPGWAESAHYDIQAKGDAETVTALRKLPDAESVRRRRAMMRAMLAERFQLKAHPDTKELPLFALVVAKGGTKLTEADPNNTYANGLRRGSEVRGAGSMDNTRGSITGQAVTIETIETQLALRLHRQVVDRTGLHGKYDFTLHFAPDDEAGSESEPVLPTALEEQLGLKLVATKGPVATVVVERVEPPSEDGQAAEPLAFAMPTGNWVDASLPC